MFLPVMVFHFLVTGEEHVAHWAFNALLQPGGRGITPGPGPLPDLTSTRLALQWGTKHDQDW